MANEVLTQGTALYVATGGTVITKIGNVPNVDGLGGASSDIDVTNFDSTAMEYLQGLNDEGTASINLNWSPEDASHDTLFALKQSKERVQWCVAAADGTAAPTAVDGEIVAPADRASFIFDATVQQIQWNLAANDVIRASLSLRISGAIEYDNGQGS